MHDVFRLSRQRGGDCASSVCRLARVWYEARKDIGRRRDVDCIMLRKKDGALFLLPVSCIRDRS